MKILMILTSSGRIVWKFPHDTKCVGRRYQTRNRGIVSHPLALPYVLAEIRRVRGWLSVQFTLSCSVSFQRGSGSLSTYSAMFVQGPQIIKERSGNSEDDSDEEGPEDILQVHPSEANLTCCEFCAIIYLKKKEKYIRDLT